MNCMWYSLYDYFHKPPCLQCKQPNLFICVFVCLLLPSYNLTCLFVFLFACCYPAVAWPPAVQYVREGGRVELECEEGGGGEGEGWRRGDTEIQNSSQYTILPGQLLVIVNITADITGHNQSYSCGNRTTVLIIREGMYTISLSRSLYSLYSHAQWKYNTFPWQQQPSYISIATTLHGIYSAYIKLWLLISYR